MGLRVAIGNYISVKRMVQKEVAVVGVVILEYGKSKLVQVAPALNAPRSFPRRLYGRQKQGDERTYNGDYHEKFNQRESGCAAGPEHSSLLRNWLDIINIEIVILHFPVVKT
jgi:hypothetical protein